MLQKYGPIHILDAQISMLGAVAHPQDPRLDLPEKGRDRTAGDRLVYQDRMVEDLSWAYPGQRGEEDLSPVCPEDAGPTCQAGFENILS